MTTDIPFDLYGELEDAYDAADRNGDAEIVETLDAFGLWDERPKADSSFMLKAWRGLNGDTKTQADLGHAFLWTDMDPEETRKKHRWLDKPLLAIYWCGLAAEAGCAAAQNDLACLYCPEQQPYGTPKVGRLARHWLEEAAAQKHTPAMRDLARCLRCGKCACCNRDIPRADALAAEANELDQMGRLG